MTSTVEWAREHGEHRHGTVALDNHEPTRDYAYVHCYRYSTDTVENGYIIDGALTWKDGRQAVYLMDDGCTVRPYYVAAYHPDHEYVIIHPFPVSDGRLRPDGRPVDFSSWLLGPRRAYHVKLAGALEGVES